MLICPSCNTECPDNSNFCLNCGIPLKSTPESVKQADDKNVYPVSNDPMTQMLKRLMPVSYAEKLFANKGRMQGERRIVTILFSDVTGSTAIAENLDPEEVLEVMNGAFSVLIKPVLNYEGTIARLMGDAILAFFGAPVAHEDDSYRACRAALDILEGAGEFAQNLERERGIKGFSVRVGINTGLVVVGEVGTDLRGEYTAMGDEVNVAARMESAAEPGTILITEATRNLVKNDFEFLSLGPIKVKGKSEPINSYRILDLKRSGDILHYNSKFNSPIVGRDNELRDLRAALDQLMHGNGGIISIIGDNGSGKSRLVSEIRKFRDSDVNWAEGKALAHKVNSSYWMFRSFLKNFLGFHQESLDKTILDNLYNRVEELFGTDLGEVYPYIEHFLWPSAETKRLTNLKLNDSRSIQGQFRYAFKEFIKKESAQKPIVLLLEDLQWCDSPSLDLVNEMFQLIDTAPVLFLLIYRLNESYPGIWEFHNNNLEAYRDKHKVINVHPLPEEDCILLIKNILGGHPISPQIQNRIIKRTEGNPAFLEEVIHSFIELGQISGGNLTTGSIKTDHLFRVPDILHNSIIARVDNLDQSDKIVLQTASVIGRVFQEKLLTRILVDKLSSSEVEKSLTELQLREFILRHLPTNIIPGKTGLQKEYIFKQEVIQSVVYNSLLLTQRQVLHKQIGEDIEKTHSQNFREFADSLALHFEKAKVFNKAVNYARMAADRARDFFANEDAIFFYLKTLKLSEKSRLESSEFAQIYESLGDIYSIKAEYSKAIEHFKLSSNYQGLPGDHARIYYKYGRVFDRWGKYETALEMYKKGLSFLNIISEKVLTANIFAAMGMVYFRQDNLKEALDLNAKALATLREFGNETDIADVFNNLGIIYSQMGNLEKSLEFHMKCLDIREKLGSSGGLAAANNNLGFLYQLRNEPEKAIEYYNKSLEYWEKTGNLHGLARTYDNLSQIYISKGNDDLGMDYNIKAISILGRIAGDASRINSDFWLQSGVW